jgi:uncharacterized membrane protein (DUF106 family)
MQMCYQSKKGMIMMKNNMQADYNAGCYVKQSVYPYLAVFLLGAIVGIFAHIVLVDRNQLLEDINQIKYEDINR